jgi:hypothetical protein
MSSSLEIKTSDLLYVLLGVDRDLSETRPCHSPAPNAKAMAETINCLGRLWQKVSDFRWGSV